MRLPGPYTRAGILIYAVPLYAGPLLAGLSHASVAVIPVLAAAFGLLSLKGRVPDLSESQGWAGLAILLLVQGLLVGSFYGLGRLFAWPFGPLPLPVWVPLVLTLSATAFGLWRYRNAAGLDELLDHALEQVQSGTPENAPDVGSDLPGSRHFLDHLIAMDDPRAAFSEALAAMDEGSDAIDLAAIQFLSRPRIRASVLDEPRLGMALRLGLTSYDDRVRAAAVDLTFALIADDAGYTAFPPADRLPEIAELFPDTARALLAVGTHLSKPG